MRVQWLPLVLAGLVAGGCDRSDDVVVEACVKAIEERVEGRSHALDRRDMRRSVERRDGHYVILSTVVFAPGLPNEYRQRFECRARLEDGQGVVTFLQFQW